MKKTAIIANIAIAVVLLVLSISIFSVDLDRVYTTVAAPITIGNENLKNVSFMICIESDTDAVIVDEMMNILALRKASATFFVAGSWVMKNPQSLKNMSALKFEIANYGFSGKSIKSLSAEKQKKEMLDTHTLVKGITGVDMKLFFPPVREYSKDTLKTASALGYTVVLSCCDAKSKSLDATAEGIRDNATQKAKNGDLILICPTHLALQAMPSIIDFYSEQNFGIVKVSDNIVNP